MMLDFPDPTETPDAEVRRELGQLGYKLLKALKRKGLLPPCGWAPRGPDDEEGEE